MYKCTKCGYETNDRSNFTRHLKKKRPCNVQSSIDVVQQEVEKLYSVISNRTSENKLDSNRQIKKMLEDLDLINKNLVNEDKEKLSELMEDVAIMLKEPN